MEGFSGPPFCYPAFATASVGGRPGPDGVRRRLQSFQHSLGAASRPGSRRTAATLGLVTISRECGRQNRPSRMTCRDAHVWRGAASRVEIEIAEQHRKVACLMHEAGNNGRGAIDVEYEQVGVSPQRPKPESHRRQIQPDAREARVRSHQFGRPQRRPKQCFCHVRIFAAIQMAASRSSRRARGANRPGVMPPGCAPR